MHWEAQPRRRNLNTSLFAGGCTWDIINIGETGETGSYSPEYLPNGAQLWGTAGAQNN